MATHERSVSVRVEKVHVYKDSFGRIYIDKCHSAEEHMKAPADERENRRLCQFAFEELMPMAAFDGPGELEIIVRFTPKTSDGR